MSRNRGTMPVHNAVTKKNPATLTSPATVPVARLRDSQTHQNRSFNRINKRWGELSLTNFLRCSNRRTCARDLPDRATTALAKVTSARSLGRGAIEIAVGVQNRSTQRARAVSTVGEAVEIDHCAGMAAIRQLKYPAMSIGDGAFDHIPKKIARRPAGRSRVVSRYLANWDCAVVQ